MLSVYNEYRQFCCSAEHFISLWSLAELHQVNEESEFRSLGVETVPTEHAPRLGRPYHPSAMRTRCCCLTRVTVDSTPR